MSIDTIDQIKQAMAEQGMTQVELAQRCGVRQPRLSDVFRRVHQPSFGLVQRMMDVLGIETVRTRKRLTQDERQAT